MKTFKLLFAAIIFVGFANAVSAQTSDDASITASAQIFRVLEVNNQTNLDFGVIFLGQTATLNPQDDTRNNVGGLGQTEEFGLFSVSGNPNASFSVTLPDNVTLNHTDGAGIGTIDIDLANYYGYSTTNAYAASDVSEILNNADATLNADGDGYIWVGGQIDLSAGTTENGVYTGDIQVTVDYNNL